jgi:hypothetical protein
MGETLADDAWTASPPQEAVGSRAASPPVPDLRVESPPRTVEAGGVTFAGYIWVVTPLGVIDVDPISTRPTGAQDLIRGQPQID